MVHSPDVIIVLFPASSFDSVDSTSCLHRFDRCHYGQKWLGRDPGDNICEEQCRSHDERRCIRQRHPRSHFTSQCALPTLLLGSSTVEESVKKEDVDTCFGSLLDNTASLEDVEHSNALRDIGDLLMTRLTDVCSSC